MEYWSAKHRQAKLSESERESRIQRLLEEISLPSRTERFDYFAVYRATDDSSRLSGQVTAQYFSSFSEARDWWAGLSRNSYQLSDGNHLVDRISGTRQELLSALGRTA